MSKKTKIVQILRRQVPGHPDIPLIFTVGQHSAPPGAAADDLNLFPVVEKITSIKNIEKFAHSPWPSFLVHFAGSTTSRSIPAAEVVDVAYELEEEVAAPALPEV